MNARTPSTDRCFQVLFSSRDNQPNLKHTAPGLPHYRITCRLADCQSCYSTRANFQEASPKAHRGAPNTTQDSLDYIVPCCSLSLIACIQWLPGVGAMQQTVPPQQQARSHTLDAVQVSVPSTACPPLFPSSFPTWARERVTMRGR